MIEIEAPLAVRLMFYFALAFVIVVIAEMRFLYPRRVKRRNAARKLQDK